MCKWFKHEDYKNSSIQNKVKQKWQKKKKNRKNKNALLTIGGKKALNSVFENK
jgi:hypothetical protein